MCRVSSGCGLRYRSSTARRWRRKCPAGSHRMVFEVSGAESLDFVGLQHSVAPTRPINTDAHTVNHSMGASVCRYCDIQVALDLHQYAVTLLMRNVPFVGISELPTQMTNFDILVVFVSVTVVVPLESNDVLPTAAPFCGLLASEFA